MSAPPVERGMEYLDQGCKVRSLISVLLLCDVGKSIVS